ncbi:hypothetical protein F5883DRAFT_146001 [Diaporthe sp. PMI_573]|nr:hypothetical protein F5883DRAFT_146001 [Diaporthaceae sp. PMI_573]
MAICPYRTKFRSSRATCCRTHPRWVNPNGLLGRPPSKQLMTEAAVLHIVRACRAQQNLSDPVTSRLDVKMQVRECLSSTASPPMSTASARSAVLPRAATPISVGVGVGVWIVASCDVGSPSFCPRRCSADTITFAAEACQVHQQGDNAPCAPGGRGFCHGWASSQRNPKPCGHVLALHGDQRSRPGWDRSARAGHCSSVLTPRSRRHPTHNPPPLRPLPPTKSRGPRRIKASTPECLCQLLLTASTRTVLLFSVT